MNGKVLILVKSEKQKNKTFQSLFKKYKTDNLWHKTIQVILFKVISYNLFQLKSQMVSRQSHININPVSGVTALQDCILDMCPSQLLRAETTHSERQHQVNDLEVVSTEVASNELREQNSKQEITTTIPQTFAPAPSPCTNLFAGSMYWTKVARNDVYPKYLMDCESDQKLSNLRQSQEQANHDALIGDQQELSNLLLQYDSESEWFDENTEQYEKCLSV